MKAKLYSYNGKTQSIRAWAKELNISSTTLSKRLKTGLSFEKAIAIRYNYKDYNGIKFGKLTALSFCERKDDKTYWNFICECGNLVVENIHSSNLSSCGCYNGRSRKGPDSPCFNDISNQKFGKLTAIKYIAGGKRVKWLFKCECGNDNFICYPYRVLDGTTTSCGCNHHLEGSNSPHFSGIKELSGYYFSSLKHGALSRGLEFNITKEHIYNLLVEQKFKCILSNIDIKLEPSVKKRRKDRDLQTASLDRIDSSKGYIEENVQWVHKKINIMKQDLNQKQFIDYCIKIKEKHD